MSIDLGVFIETTFLFLGIFGSFFFLTKWIAKKIHQKIERQKDIEHRLFLLDLENKRTTRNFQCMRESIKREMDIMDSVCERVTELENNSKAKDK